MGAGGDFRHDAAVRPMRLVLPDDGLREDLPVAGDQRRGAVVAGGFEAEDESHFGAFARPFAYGARDALGVAAMQELRLGTSGSPLALAQARKVAAAIETAQRWPDGWVQIVEVKTTGDQVQDRPLAEIGGKALWTKELDRALLSGRVDFCVHSMKDVESVRPEASTSRRCCRAATCATGSSARSRSSKLKRGRVSAPRRRAAPRSCWRCGRTSKIVPIRGNVETRLKKVESGRMRRDAACRGGPQAARHQAGTSRSRSRSCCPLPAQA